MALFGYGNFSSARKVVSGQRGFRVHNVLHCTLGNDGASVHSSTRTDVNNMVGVSNRIFVMLDNEDGVTNVTQVDECSQ